MRPIRKLAVATVFTLSSLSLSVRPASAQAEHGRFSLSHEVHWQNAVLPAGEYVFSGVQQGPSRLLMIHKLDRGRASYLMLVKDAGPSQSTGPNRLVVVSTPNGSFVDRMELPKFGVILHFKVPVEISSGVQANAAGAGK